MGGRERHSINTQPAGQSDRVGERGHTVKRFAKVHTALALGFFFLKLQSTDGGQAH